MRGSSVGVGGEESEIPSDPSFFISSSSCNWVEWMNFHLEENQNTWFQQNRKRNIRTEAVTRSVWVSHPQSWMLLIEHLMHSTELHNLHRIRGLRRQSLFSSKNPKQTVCKTFHWGINLIFVQVYVRVQHLLCFILVHSRNGLITAPCGGSSDGEELISMLMLSLCVHTSHQNQVVNWLLSWVLPLGCWGCMHPKRKTCRHYSGQRKL